MPKTPVIETRLGLPDYWYVLAPTGRIGTDPLSVSFCGKTVSLWRTGGVLACDDPAVALCEQDGYVWGWYGDGAPGPRPPVLAAVSQSRLIWAHGSLPFAAGFIDSVENTLDLVHPAFAHPYTHPTWLLHRLGLRPRLRVVVNPDAQGWQGEGFFGNRLVMRHTFRLPDQAYLCVFPNSPLETHTYAHHVPISQTACRFEFLFGRRAQLWERSRRVDVADGWDLHAQDQRILTAMTRNRLRYPELREQHCAADAYTLFFRKVLHCVREGIWEQEWHRFQPFELSVRL